MTDTDLAFYGAILQVAGTMFAVLGGLLAATLMDASRRASAIRMRLRARAFDLVMAQRRLGIDALAMRRDYVTRILPQMEALSDLAQVDVPIPSTQHLGDVFASPRRSWVTVPITREDEAVVRQWGECMATCAEIYRQGDAERALPTSSALWNLHHRLDELRGRVFDAGRRTQSNSPWRRVLAELDASLGDQMARIAGFDTLSREAKGAVGISFPAVVLLFMAALAGAGIIPPLWRLVGSPDNAALALALSAATLGFLGLMATSAVALRRHLLILDEDALNRPELASPGEHSEE